MLYTKLPILDKEEFLLNSRLSVTVDFDFDV